MTLQPCPVCNSRAWSRTIDAALRELAKGGQYVPRCPPFDVLVERYAVSLEDLRMHATMHLRFSVEQIAQVFPCVPQAVTAAEPPAVRRP